MPVISIDQLLIENRQRTGFDPQHISELAESIAARGLLHAPVVRHDPSGHFSLVAGGCRIAAIKSLWETEPPVGIIYDSKFFPPGELPVVLADLQNASEWMSAEYEENAIRRELPWQDRVRAIASIHQQRLLENPTQDYSATARELTEAGATGAGEQREAFHSLRRDVKESAIVAQHLDKYKIKNARNAHEAFGLLMQEEQKRWEVALLKKEMQPGETREIEVRHGDLLEILPLLDNDRFDLILADPPYGIGADAGGFRTRAIQHHSYDDSATRSRLLLSCIISEGFRVCKPRSNLFVFTDIQHFEFLGSRCGAAGWVPWRTPIIWQKSRTEGLAPWGRAGFRRTFDIIFFATKGQRGLIHSPVDILEAKRVSKADRTHGAEKPVDLLRQLVECSTMVGDSVLDPCCGVGSTLQALRQTHRKGLGIELDLGYYNIALTRANTDDPADDN
jgi:site-specific DNA-methyltransferase (adenine-specific)